MADLASIFVEVGKYGFMSVVGIELVSILGALTAWKLGLPLNDMKTPVLRIAIRLSQPPRKFWDFKRGVSRLWRSLKSVRRAPVLDHQEEKRILIKGKI